MLDEGALVAVGGGRPGHRVGLGHEPVEIVEQRRDQRGEHVFLRGEVVVERALCHAEALGDVADRGAGVSLLDEQVDGDVEDALAGVVRRASDRTGHRQTSLRRSVETGSPTLC